MTQPLSLFGFRGRKREDVSKPSAPADPPTSPSGLPVVPAEEILNALFEVRDSKVPDPTLFVVDKKRGGARNLKQLFVSGQLDLSDARLEHALKLSNAPSLTLNGCEFEKEMVLAGARVGAIDLRGAKIPGVDASSARLEGGVDFSFAEIEGTVLLRGAKIDGDLLFNGATIKSGPDEKRALVLSGATVEGDFHFHALNERRAEVLGRIDGIGLTVKGQIAMGGTRCSCPGDVAMDLQSVRVNGSVFLNSYGDHRFEADGVVSLMMADIRGGCVISGGRFSNPPGNALVLEDAVIAGPFHAIAARKGDPRLEVFGTLQMVDTEISGGTNFSGALLVVDADGRRAKQNALRMDGAMIESDLIFATDRDGRAFEVNGKSDFSGLTVTKSLICRGAIFREAVEADALTVGERLVMRRKTQFQGRLNLQNAKIGEIHDHRDCWPERGNLILDGLEYKRFSDSRDDAYSPSIADIRLEWLGRQSYSRSYFAPIPSQPYVQLAHVLTAMGQKPQSTKVLARLQLHRLRRDLLYLADPMTFLAAAWLIVWIHEINILAFLLVAIATLLVLADGFVGNRLEDAGFLDMARAWRRRPQFGSLDFVPRFFLWATAGHGYYPERAIVWLAALLTSGGLIFDVAHGRGLMYPHPSVGVEMGFENLQPSVREDKQPPTYPRFNAWAYSLNVLIPFLELHQLSHWIPVAIVDRPCGSISKDEQSFCSSTQPPPRGEGPAIVRRTEAQGTLPWIDPATWLNSWSNWMSEFGAEIASGRWFLNWLDNGGTRTWLLLQMIAGLALSVTFAAGFAGLLQPKEE